MPESGAGCPVKLWDGPYKYRCGLGEERGVCAYHGRFRDDRNPHGFVGPVDCHGFPRAPSVAPHVGRGRRLVPPNAVALIEQVLADGQEEHGDRWRTRPVVHHVGKAMGHGRRALGRTPIDADSGHPHLALAAARMVLALAVHLERQRR